MIPKIRTWGATSLAILAAGAILVGCSSPGEKTPAEEDQAELKIGLMFDLTGALSALGEIDQQALDLVLEDAQARAAEGGVALDVTVNDSQSNPDEAVQLARQYVRDGAQAVVGPSPQGSCLATRQFLEGAGVLQYCLSGGPLEWSPLFFSGELPPEGGLGLAPVQFFKEQGWSHVGCLAPTGPSGDAYAVPTRAMAEKEGLEFTLEEYPADSMDVTPQLVKMRAAGVEVVYACSSGTGIVTVARAVSQLGWDVPLFAGQGAVNMDVLQAAKGFIPEAGLFSNGNYVMIPDAMPEDDPRFEAVTTFAHAYQEAYGAPATVTAATLVDALNLIVNAAIELHADGKEIDGAAMAAIIEQTTGYPGIVSTYDFSTDMHRGSQTPDLIFRWTPEGEFELFE